jgi:hypothetical protein
VQTRWPSIDTALSSSLEMLGLGHPTPVENDGVAETMYGNGASPSWVFRCCRTSHQRLRRRLAVRPSANATVSRRTPLSPQSD